MRWPRTGCGHMGCAPPVLCFATDVWLRAYDVCVQPLHGPGMAIACWVRAIGRRAGARVRLWG